jgi:cyclopropane fatty-acyl-phospholipid synthase-like methyltransferase
MNKSRFSSIAHGGLPLWNPIAVGHLQQYVSQLALPENGAVLDIGCGRGHVLNLVLARHPVRAIGVDSSNYAMAHAARDLAALVAAGRLVLVERAFDVRDYDPSTSDLVVCIGATHAIGDYRETLRVAGRILKPDGLLLVGEGYWKRAPDAEYLAFLQMSSDEHSTHQGNQSACSDEGFDLVSCSECGQSEWDAYEDQYAANVEEFVRANPHDPDAEAMLERIRPWREAYLRRGRDTLGFGLYLFRVQSGGRRGPP